MIDLAYAMGPMPGGGSSPGSVAIQLIPMVLVFAIFFFLLLAVQRFWLSSRQPQSWN